MKIFAYGTLQKDYGNNRLLRDCSLVSKGIVRNHRLYHSGFPVSTPSEGFSITGEIWEIPQELENSVLHNLDALEGHRGNNNPSSMYLRNTVTAFADDGTEHQTEIYQGNPIFWKDFKGMRECNVSENTYSWGR